MAAATPAARPEDDVTAEELTALVRALGLVPIPAPLMPRVLANVRLYRAALRRLDEADLELSDVVTAQPFRVIEAEGDR